MDNEISSITPAGGGLRITRRGESREEYRQRLSEMSKKDLVESLDECECEHYRLATENEKLKGSLSNTRYILGLLALTVLALSLTYCASPSDTYYGISDDYFTPDPGR